MMANSTQASGWAISGDASWAAHKNIKEARMMRASF
jgi:hypothetical protein